MPGSQPVVRNRVSLSSTEYLSVRCASPDCQATPSNFNGVDDVDDDGAVAAAAATDCERITKSISGQYKNNSHSIITMKYADGMTL